MNVSATLVGGQTPQLVQIVVDETPVGETWTLTGSTGDFSWEVPGGRGVGNGQEQLTRVDNQAPGNVPVTYTFRSATVVETSQPVTVRFDERVVLQTLNGQRTLQVALRMGSDLMEYPTNVATFRVPGRSRPVVRYDVLGDVVASLGILVPLSASKLFRQLLESGAPILYRLGEPVVDLDPAGVIQITRAASPEVFYARNERAWDLAYERVDNPFADIPIGAFSWDVFDDSFTGATWMDGFDQTFRDLTWDQFDTFDWSTL